jgi:RNA polymerase sigma-70 factor (ECF subfamily)
MKNNSQKNNIVELWLLDKNLSKESVLNKLMDLYHDKLYVLVRRMVVIHEDTDDLLQEIWIKIWQNLDKFKGNSNIYTWIYRIAINETLQFLKRKKRFIFIETDAYVKEQIKAVYQGNYISGNEIQLKLQEAMLLLPEKQRIVFQMRYFDELKFKDIAEILNQSTGGVKANYHLAVKKIEEFLKTKID